MPDFEEPVEIVAYDDGWPARFAEASGELRGVFGDRIRGIEHFGSTAVPGLAAKPVIDILVGVEALTASSAEVAAMGRLGYEEMGAGAVPGRLHFRRRGTPERWVNANLVIVRGSVWRDNLLIRNYLRRHGDEARAYAKAKRVAAATHPLSLLAYSRAKAPFLAALLTCAAAERAASSPGCNRQ